MASIRFTGPGLFEGKKANSEGDVEKDNLDRGDSDY